MDLETLREYCLSKKGVVETFPFGEDFPVYKVKGKMFALLMLDEDIALNLKCDPEKAIELREHYRSVIPGYHMNKKHWNTVFIDGSVPESVIYECIDDSYRLVAGVSKSQRRKPVKK